jgi:probable O-glycosylation ligase (exosortase A-associated)
MKKKTLPNSLLEDTEKFDFYAIVFVLYLFFEFVRPQSEMLPFLSYLKIPMILSLILIFKFLKSDKKILHDRLILLCILFLADIGIGIFFAPNTYYVWKQFQSILLIFLCAIVIMPQVFVTPKSYFKLINLWLAINTIGAIYAITHRGHGPGGFLFDENDMALSLNMAIPLAYYLSLLPENTKVMRFRYLAVTFILILGSGSTMSRGGFLGMVAIAGAIWWFSGNRIKYFFIGLAVLLVVSYPIYKLIPESYISEMSTIEDTNDSTRNQRTYFWGLGWDMYLDNPVFGVGAGNFPWRISEYQLRRPDFDPSSMKLMGGRPAHSLYFTLLPELGTVGLIIYSFIVLNLYYKLRYIINCTKNSLNHLKFALISKALIVSMITFFITAAFISVLYYPPFWYLVAFAVTIHNIARSESLLTGNYLPNSA